LYSTAWGLFFERRQKTLHNAITFLALAGGLDEIMADH
jgi:hypothetical protein